MRTVRLYGELAEKYGRVHRLEVRTPAEAVRALMANYPDFENHMVKSQERGVGYRVRNGTFELQQAEQVREPASGDIRIMPVVIGAGGNGVTSIIIGAALIAAAVVLAPYTAGTSLAFLPTVLGGIGISMALGGVASLISPPPKAMEPKEPPENEPSYAFNGPVNTTAQGHPVPVGYGRLIVGGATVSVGISIEQLKTNGTRVKSVATREVLIIRATGEALNIFDQEYKKIPDNWFKREFIEVFELDLGGPVDLYRYYYYVWARAS